MKIGFHPFGMVASTLGVAALAALTAPSVQASEEILQAHCGSCHEKTAAGYERIADVRKTPEGWDMTLARMITNQGVVMSSAERRTLVKYLSDNHGLSPSESAGFRYALEKTPGVLDSGPSEEMSQMCGRCHTYARVGLQRRTRDDWLKLIHFHLGQFPTTEYQALARDRDWWGIATSSVLEELAKSLPLDADAWSDWKNKKAADFSGDWRYTGWQPGVGAYEGEVILSAAGPDEYRVSVISRLADGTTTSARGNAIVYSGHEMRVSVTDSNGMAQRAVLSTGGDSETLSGRWFVRENDVIGGTIMAARADGQGRVLSVVPDHLKAGTTATVAINGAALSGDISLGDGVSVKVVEQTAGQIVVEATASPGAAGGPRTVKVGGASLDGGLTVYDAVAAIKVEPAQTYARVGGNGGPIAPVPAQFQAVGFMAGPDGEAGNDDDIRIGIMSATWAVANFDETAEAMDDVKFAGKMTPMGLFQPAGAGPNPARPMSTNNAGNLKVIATVKDGETTHEGSAQLFVTVQRFVDAPIR